MSKTTRSELSAVVGSWIGVAVGATAWIIRAAFEVWPERTDVALVLLLTATAALAILPVMAIFIRLRRISPSIAFRATIFCEWICCNLAALTLLGSGALAFTSFSTSDLWSINIVLGVLFLLTMTWARTRQNVVLSERGYQWLMPKDHH